MKLGGWGEASGFSGLGSGGSDKEYTAVHQAAHKITANAVESTLLAGREGPRARSHKEAVRFGE
jgi:hypothetical protein